MSKEPAKTTNRRISRKTLLQVALAGALIGPFGLYVALMHDQTGLACIWFGLITVSMLLTVWSA